jgi:hypothetical protein
LSRGVMRLAHWAYTIGVFKKEVKPGRTRAGKTSGSVLLGAGSKLVARYPMESLCLTVNY